MTIAIQPTYDDMLSSDLETLQAANDRQLAEWYWEINSSRWPEELFPPGPTWTGMPHKEWEAAQPDRLDDIMEWIRNRVGIKYLLMIWQTERMLAFVAPGVGKSDAAFEEWWKEPHPGDPSITKGEDHLRSAGKSVV